MLDVTFACPDLTTFCRLDDLGLEVTGQRLEPDRAVLACRVAEADSGDRWCRRCGCQGVVRDSVVRKLSHEPFGWRPTTLAVTVRRYRCGTCRRGGAAGPPRGGGAEGEADPGGRAVGVGSARAAASDRRAGRRRARRGVGHRQR